MTRIAQEELMADRDRLQAEKKSVEARKREVEDPIQNERKVQETAKYRDEDEANKHRRRHAVETTTEVVSQTPVEAHNEVQKVVKGIHFQKHQKHQQQENDSHKVSEMKKIERSARLCASSASVSIAGWTSSLGRVVCLCSTW